MSKIRTKLHGYNLLLTKGNIQDIPTKDKYDAHLWIDNGNVKKNHTNFTEEELDTILDNYWNNEDIFKDKTVIDKLIKWLNQNKDE